MQELFETSNGRVIMDEDLSSKMYLIKQYHPEKADETSSGFEWSEMGMANLFGLLYSHEARYCPEHKSWYTYHEGAWRKDEGAILVSEKIKDFVRLMILYCGELRTMIPESPTPGSSIRWVTGACETESLRTLPGNSVSLLCSLTQTPISLTVSMVHTTFETSPSGNIAGTIFLPCRQHLITQSLVM